MLVQRRSWDQRERGRRSWSGLRSRPRGGSRDDDLGRRWTVSEGGVRPDGVVVAAPIFDLDLSLPQRNEDLEVEQLVTELAVEALHVPVLPRAALLDVGGLGPDGRDP